MQPISGRIPDELYEWLVQTQIDGAVSTSDKLRIAIQLYRQHHEKHMDKAAMKGQLRQHTHQIKDHLFQVLSQSNEDSEVLNIVLTHVPELWTILATQSIASRAEALALEELVVKKIFTLIQSLLRQGLTQQAQALNPDIVRNYLPTLQEFLYLINQTEKQRYE